MPMQEEHKFPWELWIVGEDPNQERFIEGFLRRHPDGQVCRHPWLVDGPRIYNSASYPMASGPQQVAAYLGIEDLAP